LLTIEIERAAHILQTLLPALAAAQMYDALRQSRTAYKSVVEIERFEH